ncbi:zinc-finger domain-containing protein [Neobacillus niacini]|uniref:zinc-finger domain-containing protein n=1 Tax=Neobacillus niacini TaxID=86668 RepID=UPI002FFDE2A9
MDRKKKRAIHLRITHLLDSNCKGCEYRSVSSSYLHCRENCPIGKELHICSSKLLGKSIVKIMEREDAEYNGPLLSGRWTEEEEFYLFNHADTFTIEHLAKRLNRAHKDVYNKLWRLKKDKKIAKSLKGKKGEIGIFS